MIFLVSDSFHNLGEPLPTPLSRGTARGHSVLDAALLQHPTCMFWWSWVSVEQL